MILEDLDEENYQAVDQYLFVAGNSCGDYFGYEITEGKIKGESIYMWNHEEYDAQFNFNKVANSLRELIELYYTNKI